jgi:hypothetical protein
MIRKSVKRFSEEITPKQEAKARNRFVEKSRALAMIPTGF